LPASACGLKTSRRTSPPSRPHQGAAEGNRAGGFDQLHPDDFLLYAYLQSGEDAPAKALIDNTAALLKHMAAMPSMAEDGMETMVPAYSTEFPVIYALERREWKLSPTDT
jgi:hypothetical protein